MGLLTIAQLQFPVRYGEVHANLETALKTAEKACEAAHTDLLILPEMWSTGFASRQQILADIGSTSYILRNFSQLARSYNTNIVCGTLPEQEGSSLYNTAYVIGSDGQIKGTCRKRHLFPLMGEDSVFSRGTSSPSFTIQDVTVGVAVCFDLRFPELFLAMRNSGVQLAVIPAQFPSARLDHWLTLTRARAIENQFFVAATNCVGTCGPYDFPGNSVIVDPWGTVLSNLEGRTGYGITRINLTDVEKVRAAIPMNR